MKRKNLRPADDLPNEAFRELSKNAKKDTPRQFRDKLTRANGATPGVPTNTSQWNRWNV